MLFLEEGNGNPLQYSCLENSTDREAWQATVHGVTKSRTQLSDFTIYNAISSYVDGPRVYHVKQSKSDGERHIPYGITYLESKIWQINLPKKQTDRQQMYCYQAGKEVGEE